MRLQANKVFTIRPTEVLNNLSGEFELVFEDGEVLHTNARHTLISSFAWNMLRVFPFIPLRAKHHLSYYIKPGELLGASTHVKVIKAIAEDFFDFYPNEIVTHEDYCTLVKAMYLVSNDIYNYTIRHFTDYVGTLDITDLTNIVLSEKVRKIRNDGDYSQTGITDVQQDIYRLITTDPEFKNNNAVKLARSGLIKGKQLLQSIGPWGYPTDVDSKPFSKPIVRGYVEGMNTFYDSITESRSATLALLYANSPLKIAEYFSRKNQLLSYNFLRVDKTEVRDCGTDELYYRVIANEGELKNMAGIWMKDPDTGEYKVIKKTDKHLIGRLVGVRSIFYCRHPKHGVVCEKCFGQLARHVNDATNIGHMCCVLSLSVIIQTMLSFKHYIGSGVYTPLSIKGRNEIYFNVGEKGLAYVMKPEFKDKQVTLMIPSKFLRNISDIFNTDDIDKIPYDRVTSIEHIWLTVNDPKTNTSKSEKLSLMHQSNKAYMSKELLMYMLDNNNWHVNKRGNYEITLDNWDYSKSLFKVIGRQYNTLANVKDIRTQLESTIDMLKDRTDNFDITEYFENLISIVCEKSSTHFKLLEGLVYSNMITSYNDRDGALPKPWTESGAGVLAFTINIRSTSAAMAYQGHANFLTTASDYLERYANRPEHVMDWMLLPQDVSQYEKTEKLQGTRLVSFDHFN